MAFSRFRSTRLGSSLRKSWELWRFAGILRWGAGALRFGGFGRRLSEAHRRSVAPHANLPSLQGERSRVVRGIPGGTPPSSRDSLSIRAARAVVRPARSSPFNPPADTRESTPSVRRVSDRRPVLRPLSRVNFFLATDLHLNSPLCGLAAYAGASVDEPRGHPAGARNLVKQTLEDRVAFVLIAGDVDAGTGASSIPGASTSCRCGACARPASRSS